MKREHAIVIGGSVAGVLAARVLAATFDRVTLIDRDVFPPGASLRRGVPQARHTHGLLAGGRQAMERLLPGFTADVVAAGGLPGDVVRDIRWFMEGGELARPASGLDGVVASRPLIEHTLRRRLLLLPNVVAREGCAVEELVMDVPRRRVSGVRSGSEVLPADLVVDASGRSGQAATWLRGLGFDAPTEERVEVALSYTTRHFVRHRQALDGDLGAIVPPTPTGKRGGVMVAQEGGRWTVTLMSHFGPAAPADLEGFLAFAATLPSPAICEAIRSAEPLGDAASARFPASVRRRFEALRRFPDGYLVVGDGISSFNPIYGQGMSVAALEALALGELLVEGEHDLARRFFARAARIVDIPWSIAAGNDLRMPEARGRRTAAVNVINWYLARFLRAAQRDAALALAFHRVGNLLAPPPTLMQPRLATRVLRHAVRARLAAAAMTETRSASTARLTQEPSLDGPSK